MKDKLASLFPNGQRFVVITLLFLLLGTVILSVSVLYPQLFGGVINAERVDTTPTSTPDEPRLHDSSNLEWVNGSASSNLSNATKIERRIYAYINAERTAYEQEPYIYNPELAQVARNWSRWRALEDEYGHFTDNGISPFDRTDRAGYKCLGGHIGENVHILDTFQNVVAPNGTGINPKTPNSVARYSTQRFMGSPGHRWGILSPNFDVVGVGVYVTENNAVYVTHLFCEREASFDEAVNASTTDRFIVAIADKRAIGNESYYEGLPEAPDMPEKPPELSNNSTETVTRET